MVFCGHRMQMLTHLFTTLSLLVIISWLTCSSMTTLLLFVWIVDKWMLEVSAFCTKLPSTTTTSQLTRSRSVQLSKMLKRRMEDNVSASSSFIANAHNQLYDFYTGKDSLLQNILIQFLHESVWTWASCWKSRRIQTYYYANCLTNEN